MATRSKLVIFCAIILPVFLVLVEYLSFKSVPVFSEARKLDCEECSGERTYYLYAGAAIAPQDLMIVLHGYKSTATSTIARTRGTFEHSAAGSRNTIVIHAEASEQNWLIGDSGSDDRDDDIAYFEAVWRDVRRVHPTLKRIHLVGMSRGAMAAYVLACGEELPIASLTVYTVPMPEYAAQTCPNQGDISFHLINGTKDRLVPHLGGDIDLPWYLAHNAPDFGSVLSSEDTLEFWQRRNECEPSTPQHTVLDVRFDGTTVAQRIWDDCTSGDIAHTEIIGGGHRWPNELWSPLTWVLLGKTTREFPTSMWDAANIWQ